METIPVDRYDLEITGCYIASAIALLKKLHHSSHALSLLEDANKLTEKMLSQDKITEHEQTIKS